MKKILLASTALALSAGLAHAQGLAITGEGRMGLFYDGATWNTENRLRMNFTASASGDHGLTFGAFSRVNIQGPGATAQFSGARVWVEANNIRLTMGNQDGAIESTFLGGTFTPYSAAVNAGGNTLNGWLNIGQHAFSSGGGGDDLVSLRYTMGTTTVMVSHEVGADTEVAGRMSFDAFSVALGYTTDGGEWVLSGAYNGGSWGVGGLYTTDNGGDWQISGHANLGGGRVNGYIGQDRGDNVFGIGYRYGLGGGAHVGAGIDRNQTTATTTAQVGVAFTF